MTDKDFDEIQMIIFNIGKEEYAVKITSIQEIIQNQPTTKIPKTPEFLEGLINLRGKVIPVIDGKKKILLDKTETIVSNFRDKKVIILDIEGEITGLVVDEVSEVINVKKQDIESTPVTNNENDDLILGVTQYKGKVLIILNPGELLASHEVHEIKNLATATKLCA